MGRVGIQLAAGAALLAALVLALAGAGEAPEGLSNRQALVLGVVQGLTELLPVSSSGHLILVPWLADWDFLRVNPAFNQTFDVALHLGTLVAVVVYFRGTIAELAVAWARTLRRRRVEAPPERLAWLVLVATVPAAAIGAVGQEVIVDHLGEPWQIAIFLAGFAVLLWLADRRPAHRGASDLGFGAALAVGLAQSLALMPGVSRSGVTITAARLLGLERAAAANFSFLLLVPIVLGAFLWTGVRDILLGDLPPGSAGPFVVGTLASAGSGLVAIWALLSYVRRRDYTPFVAYRLVAAAAVVLVIAAGAREATF